MKILGIDIGKKGLRAALVDCSFRNIRKIDLIFQPYTHEMPEFDMHVVAQATDELTGKLLQRPDRIVGTISNSQITFRNLMLPTTDTRAVNSAVNLELEDELPIDLADTVWDYSILGQSRKQSFVHACATLRTSFASYVETWDLSYGSPNVLTSTIWVIKQVLGQLKMNRSPCLILDIGRIKTKFYLFYNQFPILVKEFMFDGESLVAYSELHRGNDSIILDSGFTKGLQELCNQIYQVNFIAKVNCQKTIVQIYITGHFAAFPDAARKIEELVDIPTENLYPLRALCPSQKFSNEDELTFGLAAMLAVSTQNLSKKRILNFRKREFRKNIKVDHINWLFFIKLGLGGGVVAVMMVISLFCQNVLYRPMLAEKSAAVEKLARVLLPRSTLNAIRTMAQQPGKLTKAVEQEGVRRSIIDRVTGLNKESVLTYLKNMSQSIASTLTVNMTTLEIGLEEGSSFLQDERNFQIKVGFAVASDNEVAALVAILAKDFSFLEKAEVRPITLGHDSFKEVVFAGKTSLGGLE